MMNLSAPIIAIVVLVTVHPTHASLQNAGSTACDTPDENIPSPATNLPVLGNRNLIGSFGHDTGGSVHWINHLSGELGFEFSMARIYRFSPRQDMEDFGVREKIAELIGHRNLAILMVQPNQFHSAVAQVLDPALAKRVQNGKPDRLEYCRSRVEFGLIQISRLMKSYSGNGSLHFMYEIPESQRKGIIVYTPNPFWNVRPPPPAWPEILILDIKSLKTDI